MAEIARVRRVVPAADEQREIGSRFLRDYEVQIVRPGATQVHVRVPTEAEVEASGSGCNNSNARAARRTRMSRCTPPTICIATGSPCRVSPHGTVAAGWCVRLKGYVNGVQSIQLPVASGRVPGRRAERGDRHRRRDQQVVVFVEQVHPHAKLRARGDRVHVVHVVEALAGLDDLDQARVHHARASKRDAGHGERGARVPVLAENLDGVVENPLHELDVRAELLEPSNRPVYERGDLGVHRRVTERRTVGDAQAATPSCRPVR